MFTILLAILTYIIEILLGVDAALQGMASIEKSLRYIL